MEELFTAPINVTAVFGPKHLEEYEYLVKLAEKHNIGLSAAIRMALNYHRLVAPKVGETVEVFRDRQLRDDNNL